MSSHIDLWDSVNSVSLILGIKTLILYCNLAAARQSRHCETIHVLTHFQNSFNVITWKSFRGPSEQNYILICYLLLLCVLCSCIRYFKGDYYIENRKYLWLNSKSDNSILLYWLFRHWQCYCSPSLSQYLFYMVL